MYLEIAYFLYFNCISKHMLNTQSSRWLQFEGKGKMKCVKMIKTEYKKLTRGLLSPKDKRLNICLRKKCCKPEQNIIYYWLCTSYHAIIALEDLLAQRSLMKEAFLLNSQYTAKAMEMGSSSLVREETLAALTPY